VARIIISFFMIFLLVLASLFSFEYELYTDVEDYDKIFELTEIRHSEAFELFPEDVSDLTVEDFFCEWDLGFVGSSSTEICLSVVYSQDTYAAEIARLSQLANNNVVYDTQTFILPAYVTVLGYDCTSWYALVDESSYTVHYVLLQLVYEEDIDMNHDFLPRGYYDLGDVENASYNVYEAIPDVLLRVDDLR